MGLKALCDNDPVLSMMGVFRKCRIAAHPALPYRKWFALTMIEE